MPPAETANDPFCSNCGYKLVGLTESSKCPECGKPFVEILTRPGNYPNFGKRYRSKATLFGLPVIDIAIGPKNGELRGRARGIIAIGDFAFGFLAFGGIVRGIVALGGISIGLFAMGGISLGLLVATGGLSVGGMAAGGLALGGLVVGGLAMGGIAQGGLAIGTFARGGQAFGLHTISFTRSEPTAVAMFEQFEWFFGAWPPGALGPFQPAIALLAPIISVAIVIGITAAWKLHQEPDET